MMMVLASVADALAQMTARLKPRLEGGNRDQAVLDLLREVFTETTPIRFEGNGYSDEWKQEAARRGLPNLPDTPGAIVALSDVKRTAFLVEQGVFSEREMASRLNVSLERYVKTVMLEAETLVEILGTEVIPAGEHQLDLSAAAAARLEDVGGKTSALKRRVKQVAALLNDVVATADKLKSMIDEDHHGHDETALARRLADEVRPAMDAAREAADRLEHVVDDDLWSIPKYREMLFVK
jgi:glutamine synthetase